jgi:hypothetical protein
MHKPLSNLPTLDAETFAADCAAWKGVVARAKPGLGRVVIEWNVIKGPVVFAYPASDRALGKDLIADGVKRPNDERYADYLEYEYVPRVVEAVKAAGLTPQVICTDLKPVQTQRARLRAMSAAARERSGDAGHH